MRRKSCLGSGLTSLESFRVIIRVILVLRHKFHDLALHNSILGSVMPVMRVFGSVAPVVRVLGSVTPVLRVLGLSSLGM